MELDRPVIMHYLIAFIIITLASSSAGLVNVTIDDAFGDPMTGQQILYSPENAWQRGNDCGPCTAKPTPANSAWRGTWHDATFNPNDTATNSALGQIIVASATFTGTAVYVNCILTRSTVSPDGNTDMTFFLDDNQAGVFQQSATGDKSYKFDVPVFSKTGLPNTQHTIRLEAGHAGKKALVLLDSIVYTMDDSSTSAETSTTVPASSGSTYSSTPSQANTTGAVNIGLIVGPIIAAVFVVAGLIAGILFYLRRRRDENDRHSSTDEHLVIEPHRQRLAHSQHVHATNPSQSPTFQTLSPRIVPDDTKTRGLFSIGQRVNPIYHTRPLPSTGQDAR